MPQENAPLLSGSHFGAGWKVPLSLAAGVVLVFTLLVQLDRNPPPSEIVSIPVGDKSRSESTPADAAGKDYGSDDKLKSEQTPTEDLPVSISGITLKDSSLSETPKPACLLNDTQEGKGFKEEANFALLSVADCGRVQFRCNST